MLGIDSSRERAILGSCWVAFACVNAVLTFVLAGAETIPYHLIWASFAFVYGLVAYPRWITWTAFSAVTVVTGIALIGHASAGILEWTETSEIVLMGVIVALLVWHVDRHREAQARLVEVQERERTQARSRELAARFGTHQMRTRLAIARGFVELIQQATDDDSITSDARLVIGEIDKTASLATNLLTLVRVHQTGNRLSMQLDELIASVVHRWRSTADRAWSVHSAVGPFVGDPERVEVVLDCLLENAVKFTGVEDSIVVSAWHAGPAVMMTVSDSGQGISDADIDLVFEIFKTGSAAGSRAGSGLGLSIVRAIVEARGGSVAVCSAPGEGTTFTVSIPTDERVERAARVDPVAPTRRARPAAPLRY